MKKEDKKIKKAKRDNLGDDEKEQLRKYKKKVKKVMHGNLDDEKKGAFKKKRTTKEKKKSIKTLVIMKENS